MKYIGADYKSVAQAGEDRDALRGYLGWQYSCVLWIQSFAIPGDLCQSVLFLFGKKKKKIVLDTRDNLCFAGIYQKVLCSAQTASGGWQIGSHFND